MDEPWNARLSDHHQTERVVGALLLVDGYVDVPQIERGLLASRRPELQGLIRVLRPDRHQVLLAVLRGLSEDELLSERLTTSGAREGVVRLHPAVTVAQVEEDGLDAPHETAVQELMVHIHQVLVHEGVVAADLAIEVAGLVMGIGMGRHVGKRSGLQLGGVAGVDEHQAVGFAARVAAHAVGQRLVLVEVRDVDARSGRVVGPPVVAALDLRSGHHPSVQGDLPVRAAIFQCEHLARLGAHQHDRLARERHRQRLAATDRLRPRQRIPVVRVASRLAKVRHHGAIERHRASSSSGLRWRPGHVARVGPPRRRRILSRLSSGCEGRLCHDVEGPSLRARFLRAVPLGGSLSATGVVVSGAPRRQSKQVERSDQRCTRHHQAPDQLRRWNRDPDGESHERPHRHQGDHLDPPGNTPPFPEVRHERPEDAVAEQAVVKALRAAHEAGGRQHQEGSGREPGDDGPHGPDRHARDAQRRPGRARPGGSGGPYSGRQILGSGLRILQVVASRHCKAGVTPAVAADYQGGRAGGSVYQ